MNRNVLIGITQNPNDSTWLNVFFNEPRTFSFATYNGEDIPLHQLLNPEILTHTQFSINEFDKIKNYFSAPEFAAIFLKFVVFYSLTSCVDELSEFFLNDGASDDNLQNALEYALQALQKCKYVKQSEDVVCKNF